MTQLETLIQTLCPNGVKFVKLGEVAVISRGVRVVKKDLSQIGDIPVYQNSMQPLGYYDKTNTPAYTAFVISAGAAGDIGFSDVDFWAADDCLRIQGKEYLNNKFAYYWLLKNQRYIYSQVRKASIPRLSKDIILSLQIPLPPLAVQSEIVRILDKFTLYKSELAAELAARLQQYEYYRDQLLTFDDTVKRVKLGEVANVLRGKRLTKSDLNPEAQYDVYHGGIEPLGKYNAANREGDTVMIINVGASAGCVGYSKVAFWSSDGCFCLSKNDIVNSRFLYYYLLIQEKYLQSKVRKAGIPTLDALVINNLLIPLPPLSEQERIVSILDRFDKLCHDIREGLPAEIDLRQKQYEHYRDKLLTFNQPTPNPSLKGRE